MYSVFYSLLFLFVRYVSRNNMICKIKKADEGEEKKNSVDNKRTIKLSLRQTEQSQLTVSG
jgi:hypothetical protein